LKKLAIECGKLCEDMRYKRVTVQEARVMLGLLDKEFRALELRLRYGREAENIWDFKKA
jgi:hypothetical protein